MERFAGKVVVVTAAGGTGTGGVAARRFASEGARVVASDIDETGLETLARAHAESGGGGELVTQRADASKLDEVEELVELAVSRFGQLDVMINHAGIGSFGRVTEMAPEEWRRIVDGTLDPVYYGSRVAIPHLERTGGCIVNTASISGMGGDYAMPAYDAAKAAVINLTRSLAVDHAEQGIRVNCVSPGAIYYEGIRPMWDRIKDEYVKRVPLGRFARPEDIAAGIAFLASDDASYITGHNLVVDGGTTATSGQYQFVRVLAAEGIEPAQPAAR